MALEIATKFSAQSAWFYCAANPNNAPININTISSFEKVSYADVDTFDNTVARDGCLGCKHPVKNTRVNNWGIAFKRHVTTGAGGGIGGSSGAGIASGGGGVPKKPFFGDPDIILWSFTSELQRDEYYTKFETAIAIDPCTP